MRGVALVLVSFWAAWSSAAAFPADEAFEKKARPDGAFQLLDGDRVVFLGDTFTERAQAYDYIEARLTSLFPDRHVTFRNLGWSGDTVFGHARAGFGQQPEGFAQLQKQVHTLRPTVIFVAYGAVSSFEGEAGLADFRAGLQKLLATLDVTHALLVFVTPPRHENLGPPWPDPTAHNADVERYAAVIRDIAKERQAPVIDLTADGLRSDSPAPFTDNGLHFHAAGYWQAARVWTQDLGLDARWEVTADLAAGRVTGKGTKLSEVQAAAAGLAFTATDAALQLGAPPPKFAALAAAARERVLRATGLPAGRFQLAVDDQVVAEATAEQWGEGVSLTRGPEFDQAEELRRTIVKKNRLFFYRWRPQNETYLFGFRKHEQGNNAKEVPEFDPLVEAQEKIIAELRVPKAHRYELKRVRP